MNKDYHKTEEYRLVENLKEVLMHHDLSKWTEEDIKSVTEAADYLEELGMNT